MKILRKVLAVIISLQYTMCRDQILSRASTFGWKKLSSLHAVAVEVIKNTEFHHYELKRVSRLSISA